MTINGTTAFRDKRDHLAIKCAGTDIVDDVCACIERISCDSGLRCIDRYRNIRNASDPGITGITRSLSTIPRQAQIRLEDSPPISMMSAPSFTIFNACSTPSSDR
jgi:hypothetical protein